MKILEGQKTLADAILESSRNDMEILDDRIAYLAKKINSTAYSTVSTFHDGSTIEITGTGVVH